MHKGVMGNYLAKCFRHFALVKNPQISSFGECVKKEGRSRAKDGFVKPSLLGCASNLFDETKA